MVDISEVRKKENSENNHSKKLDIFMIVILVILIFLLQLFGIYGRTTFMTDFTHMFEGGYRIMIGQIPYQDFYTPIGPVSFAFLGLFYFIFGPSIFSSMLHSFFLIIVLVIPFYFIVRKEFNVFLASIFSLFFYISYMGFSFHTLYNYTTYFFLFLNIFLIIFYIKKEHLPTYVYFVSAILGALDFYSKQDTGALHIILLFIFFIINYPKDWKRVIFTYLIPALLFLIGTYLFLSTLGGFNYWFNLGQPQNKPVLSKFFEPEKIVFITSSWHFYVGIILVFLILFRKIKDDYKKKIASLFLVIAISNIVSNVLSGSTRQLSVMGLPILIFFMYILMKDFINEFSLKNKTLFSTILILILIVNINPFPTYGLIILNFLNPNVERIDQGCFKGYPITKDAAEGLKEIRDLIDKYPNFISLTEDGFLYCDYNKEPPKKIPLLFQEGIHFHLQDIDYIANQILESNPQIIFIQDYHGNDHPDTKDKFINIFKSQGYKKTQIINKTSTYEAPITVLIRD